MKLTRNLANILNVILTAAYIALAVWVDWRVAVIISLYDISLALDILDGLLDLARKEEGGDARDTF